MKKRCKCTGARMDYNLSIRLSKEEYELIDKLAKDNGVTKANLIMEIFLNAISRRDK